MYNGIGETTLAASFARTYVFPPGQNGAAAGKYFQDNGGTAPGGWPTQEAGFYQLSRNGNCTYKFRGYGGDPNGAGDVTLRASLPYSAITPISGSEWAVGMGKILYGGGASQEIIALNVQNGDTHCVFNDCQTPGGLNNSWLDESGDWIAFRLSYRAF